MIDAVRALVAARARGPRGVSRRPLVIPRLAERELVVRVALTSSVEVSTVLPDVIVTVVVPAFVIVASAKRRPFVLTPFTSGGSDGAIVAMLGSSTVHVDPARSSRTSP